MANSNSDNLIALFVDYENFFVGFRKELDQHEELDWKRILNFVRGDTGRIVVKRAYANWSQYSKDSQRELLGHGFELINTPYRGSKNAADIKIVIDAIEILREQDQKIDHYFLISGDSDFIDLVHLLHKNGKIVRGMGVKDTVSSYFWRVCDAYMYYDDLINPTLPDKSAALDDTPPEPELVKEARQLLWESIQIFGNEWFDAAVLNNSILRQDPRFNWHKYGFEQLKDFLDANDDLLETRYNDIGRLQVKKVNANGTTPDHAVSEKRLHHYLNCLARDNVFMKPTEHRKTLIINLYKIIEKNEGVSLTVALDMLTNLTEENEPNISYDIIKSTAIQLTNCNCFRFGEEKTHSEDNKLWGRTVRVRSEISSDNDLVTWCDRGLLKKIGKCLDPPETIDPEVAAWLLYGKEGNPYKKEHVEKLISEIETPN